MKKVIAFLLCLFVIVALFLSGCSSDTQQPPQPTPVPLTQEEQNNLLLNGNILTDMLVKSVYPDSTLEQPEFEYVQILVRCLVEKEPAFKYYHIVDENPKTGYVMPTELCNTVIKQITGHVIDITGHHLTETEDGMTHIITETGWGLERYACGEFIYSSLNDDKTQVITTFELMVPDSSSGDPGHRPGGRYNTVFDIVHEEGHGTYLQFAGFEKEK